MLYIFLTMYTVGMLFTKQTAYLAVFVLFMVLVFGGAVHAVMPHDHAGGSELVWSSLHGSLRHEDKKPLAVFSVFAEIGTVLSIVLITRIALYAAPRVTDSSFDALRRGIFAYRRFG